jgi:cytosine/adenosine deaminase-related metal-dependent hydrolase
MATSENTKRVTKNRYKGTLEEGELADFIVVDIKNERMQPLFDVINNFVMSSTSSQVKSVFVNGEQIIDNYLFTKVDEEKILSEGLGVIDKLFERSGFDKRIKDGDFL